MKFLKNQECYQEKDVSREGLTSVKLIHFFRVLFSKQATTCLENFGSFLEIDFDKLKNDYGKKGIILDVDECIAPHHGEIFPEVLEKLKELKEESWEIVIFSNMKKTNRYKNLEEIGIDVITSKYAKPDLRGFNECFIYLGEKIKGLEKKELIMIGDNFLTDGGSVGAGIDFIKIEPIKTDNSGKSSLSRKVQIKVRTIVDNIALLRGNIK